MLRSLLAVGLACLLCLPLLARAADPHAYATEQVLKLEHAWVRALSEHDTGFLNQLLADNFIDVSWQGKLRTKADMLENLKAPKPATQTLSDLEVRLFGDAAIVTGLNTIVGKHQARVAKLRFTDVFVRQHNQWHAVSSQETLMQRP